MHGGAAHVGEWLGEPRNDPFAQRARTPADVVSTFMPHPVVELLMSKLDTLTLVRVAELCWISRPAAPRMAVTLARFSTSRMLPAAMWIRIPVVALVAVNAPR